MPPRARSITERAVHAAIAEGRKLLKEAKEAITDADDPTKARQKVIALLERTVDRGGTPAAQRSLAVLYLSDRESSDAIQEKAFSLLQSAALAGDTFATFHLGSCYYHGVGTGKSADKAVELWKTCQDDLAIARYSLAVTSLASLDSARGQDNASSSSTMTVVGQAPMSSEKAWATLQELAIELEKSVDEPETAATTDGITGVSSRDLLASVRVALGDCCRRGIGSAQPDSAYSAYQAVAEEGAASCHASLFSTACASAGSLCRPWEGIAEREVEMFENCPKWYAKAARAGSVEGAIGFSALLFDGCGVEQDVEKAVRVAREAAKAGHRVGLYNYGIACLRLHRERQRSGAELKQSERSSRGHSAMASNRSHDVEVRRSARLRTQSNEKGENFAMSGAMRLDGETEAESWRAEWLSEDLTPLFSHSEDEINFESEGVLSIRQAAKLGHLGSLWLLRQWQKEDRFREVLRDTTRIQFCAPSLSASRKKRKMEGDRWLSVEEAMERATTDELVSLADRLVEGVWVKRDERFAERLFHIAVERGCTAARERMIAVMTSQQALAQAQTSLVVSQRERRGDKELRSFDFSAEDRARIMNREQLPPFICSLCCSQTVDCVLLTCNHACCCSSCADSQTSSHKASQASVDGSKQSSIGGWPCPICKVAVEDVLKIYL